MRRRLGRDDFTEAYEFAKKERGSAGWFVCEAYDLKKIQTEGFLTFSGERVSYHLVPRYDFLQEVIAGAGDKPYGRWHLSHPLEESPFLFLDLARLYEQGYRTDSITDLDPVLTWVHKYGLLGVKNIRDYEDWRQGWYVEEDVEWLLVESSKAWVVLSMYEAALNNDSQAAETALDLRTLPLYAIEGWAFSAEIHPSRGDPLQRALRTAVLWVEQEVSKRCTPTLEIPFDDPPAPSKIRGGWEFNDLVGAAYLQMYWLMAAGGEVTRCEHCGRIIPLTKLQQGGKRKPPRHKRHCDDACRQAAHRAKNRRS